jgi:pimeloyl-ACP methyl ester carboxylesterase
MAETPRVCLLLDFSPESDVLLIAFGGMSGKLGIPTFEFFNVLSKLDVPVKRAYVRDLRQAWYHLGAPGVGETIDEMAVTLRGVIDEAAVRGVVTIGYSAGGYAAILFGALLGADRAIAFSPPTSLDPAIRTSVGETRSLERLRALAESGGPDPRYADLRDVLSSGRRGKIEIHYSAHNPLDVIQARRVADLPRVRTIEHQHRSHNVVKLLRDDGSLARLLRKALIKGACSPAVRRAA